MQNADQVRKQCFPDTKFEFVHEVNNHHSRNIERFSEPMDEGVLSRISLGYRLTVEKGKGTLTTVGTEDVGLSTPSTPVPATACPNL